MKKLIALLSAGALLLLSGCTNINDAATMDGTKISVKQVQDSVNEIMALRKDVDTSQMNLPSGETLNRNQVTFFVVSALLSDLAKDFQLEISDAEVKQAIAGATASVGGPANLKGALMQANIAPSTLNTYFRMYLASKKMQETLAAAGISANDVQTSFSKLIDAAAHRLHLEVNPRYGKWDSASSNIIAADLASGAVIKK